MANEEHLRMLLEDGVEVWNKWRKDNPDIEPDLSGANLCEAKIYEVDFSKANLTKANLSKVDLFDAKLCNADLSGADLTGARLRRAKLHEAILEEADLEGVDLAWADLSKADLRRANLIKANLRRADLSGAWLYKTDLSGAWLHYADLSGADLGVANLSKANLNYADISKAKIYNAKLQGADFYGAIVNGGTLVSNCDIDKDTDFSLVGLSDTRVDSGTKQLLEYNIRRMRWEQWFKQGQWWKRAIKKSVVQGFWCMSDYGFSTKRIILSFAVLSFLFAGMYLRFPCWIVVDGRPDGLTDFLHACYFSIVTMTTLGFGDIHADPVSHAGQIALMVQVLLGYILLGAMVTRFAVLFTAGGPAGKFVPMDKETKAKLDEIKNDKAERASKTPEQE